MSGSVEAPPPILTKEQQDAINRAVKQHSLMTISCALGRDWKFWKIESDASKRIQHVTFSPTTLNLRVMAGLAFELVQAARQLHRDLSLEDVLSFCTSIDLNRHLAAFCGGVKDAQLFQFELQTRLGSYAHEIRSSISCRAEVPTSSEAVAADCSIHKGPAPGSVGGPKRKRRGRPTQISDDLKRQAVEAKAKGSSNAEIAKILYRTPYPQTQQVKNVPAILRNFRTRALPLDG